MAGLLDIAPSATTVEVRGTPVDITGLSASEIARFLRAYPQLRKLFDRVAIGFDEIVDLAEDAIPKIIASGTGAPGDEKVERFAASLTLAEQAVLIEAIISAGAPDGVGPLVERLGKKLGFINGGGAASGAVASTDSPKRSRR